MGSAKRVRPERMGEKLKQIRKHFRFSFTQMANALSDEKVSVLRTDVSRFEKGHREPSYIILLRYARIVKISTDLLIDDELDLKL